MDEFDFYKELYFRENERRQEVVGSLNIPIAIVTALGSGIYFVITSFDYFIENFLTGIFITFISFTAISLLIAIYYIIRAFSDLTKGYEYSGLPYTNELYNWHKELEQYYNTYEKDKSLAHHHYKTYLIENLVKHTEHNMYVNDKKHGFIYKSKQFLIMALLLMMFTLIPFSYNFFEKDNEIYQVKVIPNISEPMIGTLNTIEIKLDSIIQYQKIIYYDKETDTTAATASPR